MSHDVTDQALWEWIDEGSPELELHLEAHPEDLERVDELRRVIEGCRRPASDEAHGASRRIPEWVGHFRLLSQIGRGGMGVVYEAEQEAPRRRVAVKLLRDAAFDDDEVSKRLAREAEALGRLAHPNIATVYEHGTTPDGEAYLALELIDGQPLDAWAAGRRSQTREIVKMMETIALAIHHAHERGIIHRDLKPSNVLVDSAGHPKVLDFGLAHLASIGGSNASSLTLSGRLLGTPAYMSPEQAAGNIESDPRSDVYTLGVMLYELLSGALPYDLSARSLPEAMRVIVEDAPLRLGKVERRLAGDLDLITGKALEKDPKHRYQSAADLAEDLQRHLAHLPIHARRPGAFHRLGRHARRHPVGVAAAGVIVVLGSFGAYAAVFNFDLGPLHEITGDWPWIKSPFDGLTWDGDTPIVRIDSTWYELLQIEGLQASYVVGFCKQHAGHQWRKRFREDLVQVLHRMGVWPFFSVELVLRDLESTELTRMEGVALTKRRRNQLRNGVLAWHFGPWEWTDTGIRVEHEGEQWDLIEVDGVSAGELRQAAIEADRIGQRALTRDLDSLFMRLRGDVPEGPIQLSLKNLASGEVLVLIDEERVH